jgi:hypothetical protein
VATVTLALISVPEERDPRGGNLDQGGQALASTALASLSLVFIEGPGFGWRSPVILSCAVAFLVSIALFPLVEHRSPRPLVPLDVFRNRAFSASVPDAGLMTFGMYGLLFVLPLYFQSIRHNTATGVGVALLPLSVLFFRASRAGRMWPGTDRSRAAGTGVPATSDALCCDCRAAGWDRNRSWPIPARSPPWPRRTWLPNVPAWHQAW